MVKIELNRNQTRLIIDMAKFYEDEGIGNSTEIQKIFHDALVEDMNPRVKHNREVVDELRELRDDSMKEHNFAQAYGFRSQKNGEVIAYKKALLLMGVEE